MKRVSIPVRLHFSLVEGLPSLMGMEIELPDGHIVLLPTSELTEELANLIWVSGGWEAKQREEVLS